MKPAQQRMSSLTLRFSVQVFLTIHHRKLRTVNAFATQFQIFIILKEKKAMGSIWLSDIASKAKNMLPPPDLDFSSIFFKRYFQSSHYTRQYILQSCTRAALVVYYEILPATIPDSHLQIKDLIHNRNAHNRRSTAPSSITFLSVLFSNWFIWIRVPLFCHFFEYKISLQNSVKVCFWDRQMFISLMRYLDNLRHVLNTLFLLSFNQCFLFSSFGIVPRKLREREKGSHDKYHVSTSL